MDDSKEALKELNQCFTTFDKDNFDLKDKFIKELVSKDSTFHQLSEESIGIKDKQEFIKTRIKTSVWSMLWL